MQARQDLLGIYQQRDMSRSLSSRRIDRWFVVEPKAVWTDAFPLERPRDFEFTAPVRLR